MRSEKEHIDTVRLPAEAVKSIKVKLVAQDRR
jgi:hypothetical protein